MIREADVDEHVPADHVGGRVVNLALERQLGRVVEPEPRGQAAVGPPGLHHLGGPVARRARSRVRHDVVRFEQLYQRGRDAQDAIGRLAVSIGGQIGLAADRGPGVEGLGDRPATAGVPDVGDQDAPAAFAPAGDDLLALVGRHDRRLGRLGHQPDRRGRGRPPGRHRRLTRGLGTASRRHSVVRPGILHRAGAPLAAARADQEPGHGYRQRGRQQQWRPAVTPVMTSRAGNRGEHAGLTVAVCRIRGRTRMAAGSGRGTGPRRW